MTNDGIKNSSHIAQLPSLLITIPLLGVNTKDQDDDKEEMNTVSGKLSF